MTVESATDPEKFALRLLVDGLSRVVSGVHQPDLVENNFRRERVHPEHVVGEGLLGHVQVAFGPYDVGPPRCGASTLHPIGPEFDGAVVLEANGGHALMVSEDGVDARVASHVGDDPSRVRSSIDGIPQQHQPIFLAQAQAVDQRSKRGQMPMDIADCKDAMASIQPPLKVGFQGMVPPSLVRRELRFARQGYVHQGEFSP